VPPVRLCQCGRRGSKSSEEQGNTGQETSVGASEDHMWFEDQWMVTSWCDE
jgi:hypothetical protein